METNRPTEVKPMESERTAWPARTVTWGAATLLALAALATLVVVALPTEADEADEPDEPDDDQAFLAGPATFTDDVAVQVRDRLDGQGTEVINLRDASDVVVDEATVPAGETLPWHTHPGPLVIVVAEGEFTYVSADDCVRREYGEGEALIDPGGDKVHTAFNPQDEEDTVLVATYLGVPDDATLTTPVEGAEAQALDDRCDIETPAPS